MASYKSLSRKSFLSLCLILSFFSLANADIASGNYSGAIAVLAPYCPNNNCINADIANADANA